MLVLKRQSTGTGISNVRATIFEQISSGTSGAVTLPSNCNVVLDDFGGTVDAIVTKISGGRPTSENVIDSGGNIIAATFDISGNWSLSSTPSSYPIAIIYRVKSLSGFDFNNVNIIGADMVSMVPDPLTISKIKDPSGNIIFDLANSAINTNTGNPAIYLDNPDYPEVSTAPENSNANEIASTAYADRAADTAETNSNNYTNNRTVHPKDGFIIREHWLTGAVGGSTGWTQNANSGSLSIVSSSTSGKIGLIRLSTGTSAISAPAISLSGSATVNMVLGTMDLSFEAEISLTNLSTSTEEFITRFGFMSGSVTSAASANGVWLEYDRATSGDVWRCVTSDTSTQTVTVTATAVTTSWVKLKVTVNAAGNSAKFYVDGVLVATITTNIPINNTSKSVTSMLAHAKTVGTTARLLQMDWAIVSGGASVTL